jgi:transcriptional regulator with XRE-family HTH domain
MSNLQRIRKERNLTQGQLAYKTKIPVKTIQAYEQWSRDINKASGDTLKKIADALGCAIDDLLEK